ncbi:protein MALE DISCOVERER 2-like isoform X2 [Canna indica]|uniref:Protein MALE DISCOVERER 2-like isoform X2 n=1 Tax=Canna indica TaxID=4628 RepID=A0AAQ3L7U4_9LILI|nr:protein MALE DISCOVERER 2-like isoform X2 [Canna indica]
MENWMVCAVSVLLWISSVYLEPCASLNEEGRALLAFKERVEIDPYGAFSSWDEGAHDPCLWFGVECSDDGEVMVLNLRDLRLEGTLAPELGELTHVIAITLHNNSFFGVIPGEIGKLQNLELLDLGHNNLSGPLPSELGNIPSLQILVLGRNRFTCSQLPYLHDCNMLLEIQIGKGLLLSNRQLLTRKVDNAAIRRLLGKNNSSTKKGNTPPRGRLAAGNQNSPSPSPSPLPLPSPSPSPSPTHKLDNTDSSSPSFEPPVPPDEGSRKAHETLIISLTVGGSFLFLIIIAAAYFLCYRANNTVTVMPWTTGLSGQLQKAFVTGVPSLRRSELETACEQFSNIIGSLSNCTLYKGTLSNGVEIAVISTIVTSAEEWSEEYETCFRNKISTLSKVNHKNFMNLVGYCEEEEPFTRLLVFEYAPNGTLFEHLHIKEAEQLDWAMRLRVTMGIAYCLEHLEQLNPPLVIRNLCSSSIYLTEDYAAKISDLEFCNEEKESELASETSNRENIVFKFGIILLEIISGRLPFSEDDGLLVLWASSYLNGKRPLMDMVDRTLNSVREGDITQLANLIRSCINTSNQKRPTMTEVAERLRTITSMTPEDATPRLSPLWWAELEIISQ